MPINEYLKQIKKGLSTGISTEHSFRPALQNMLNSMVKGITVTNEPKRQKCGAPDYIIQRKDVPIGYIEAKDIGEDLHNPKKSDEEQKKRYLNSLNNIIFTDYLEFHFYKYGKKVNEIKLADIENDKLIIFIDTFSSFETHIKDFCDFKGQTIKSAEKLAEMMAQKARMMQDVLYQAVKEEDEYNSLRDQLKAFRQILIHDLDEKTFSDIYAQTIAYGLFAARLHDTSKGTFSRQEARGLIPKSNPFLRNLFDYVSGAQLDERVAWIVDDLADILRAADLDSILSDFGKATAQDDPFIHFYETFLSAYDPSLRKSRGVYYTPEPVVNFIVRAVDDILKTEFHLPNGLADNSKTKIKVEVQGKQVDQEVHKVQILDPATGTGTFLAEVVKQIYKKFKGQKGTWSNYVENHLLPRLNGFELLMAPYTMAHIKLDMLLTETGYKPTKNQRFRIFLTNSLEEYHEDTGTLFANWLSAEANEANHIKRDTPVMCVIGNPPYSGESANKGEWIMNLMEDYKKEPGGIEKLKERNSKWINDDYVKFLRYGQYFIEKNGSGILAFINPHGFLDNPTFRGMRWNLLKAYDKIYTIDLHGNAKKKETAPDGSIDVNVFDIMQGVSINVFVKTGKKKSGELGKTFHYDLFGKREMKYDFLIKNSLKTVSYKELSNTASNYFFVEKDFDEQKTYDKGFLVNEFFPINGAAITTAHDEFVIKEQKDELLKSFQEFVNTERNIDLLHTKFNVKKKDGWNILQGFDNIKKETNLNKYIQQISLRPFDDKYIFYEDKLVWRTVRKVMQHFIKGQNIGLVTVSKQPLNNPTSYYFLTRNMISNGYIRSDSVSIDSLFPLYLYPDTNAQQTLGQTTERKPNLNIEIVKKIEEKLGLKFVGEKVSIVSSTSPNPSKGGAFQVVENFSSKGGAFEVVDNSPPKEGLLVSEISSSEISRQGYVTVNTPKKEISKSALSRPGYITANLAHYKLIKEMRESLKDNPTEAEKVMWEYLRNKKTGHKIRRQHIIDDFITDFVCLIKKVVIEIDGKIHLKQKEYDELRTIRLNELGYEVIRFTNEEVFANPELVTKKIKEKLDSKGESESSNTPPLEGTGEVEEKVEVEIPGKTFAPIDILDYIYAVLHCPKYREKYKEFLKIDFPRVPYPEDKKMFWKLVKLGGMLRQIHLLESPVVEKFITKYPVDGDNTVSQTRFSLSTMGRAGVGSVWINDKQYFDKVPVIAWEFYIGGYQPAQKWLKDRKGRTLSFEDIQHYQKIIVALSETDRIMKKIDEVM